MVCGFLMLLLQDAAVEMSEKGLSPFLIQELYSVVTFSFFFYELDLHLCLLIKGEFENLNYFCVRCNSQGVFVSIYKMTVVVVCCGHNCSYFR